jgi:hypothetical protein
VHSRGPTQAKRRSEWTKVRTNRAAWYATPATTTCAVPKSH